MFPLLSCGLKALSISITKQSGKKIVCDEKILRCGKENSIFAAVHLTSMVYLHVSAHFTSTLVVSILNAQLTTFFHDSLLSANPEMCCFP